MAKTSRQKKCYGVIMKHDAMAEPDVIVVMTYDKAVEVAHDFFLSYSFKLKDGKAFDDGNDDGLSGGFDVFDNVKYHNGLIAEFVHFGGDGPCCKINESIMKKL